MEVLLSVLLVLVVVGAVLYLINRAPIDAFIKTCANVIVCVVVLVWIIRQLLPMAHIR